MSVTVLIAHARGEEDRAEELAGPIRAAGYEVHHGGTVLVGESVVQETQKILNAGGPVVLCGTIRAVGTPWARRVVNAARHANRQNRVLVVQMEEDADTDSVTFDGKVAAWWVNQRKAADELITALVRQFPLDQAAAVRGMAATAEARYRELALESCDLVDLVNLPETDRHIALRQLELRRLYVALRVSPMREATERIDELAVERPAPAESPTRAPIGEHLAGARRLVVLGDPGSGKSTLLRWITTAYLLRLAHDPEWRELPDIATLPDEDLLPVLIRCRDLRSDHIGGSLDDILNFTLRQQEMTDAECAALRDLLRARLADGTALLLLDGLDEIADLPLRMRLCRQLERIASAYPRAPIVTTCRVVGYREMDYRIGRGFAHLVVDQLDRADKDEFAARWCTLVEPPERRADATAELIADVHSTPQIEALTGNPMLLTTMALVKRKVGKLPSRRADLYWEAVQVLLNWRREVDLPLDSREAMPQLEYLAYTMCDRGAQQLREDEVLDVLLAMRAEFPQIYAVRNHSPAEFLGLVEARTGLLVQSGEVRHKGRPVPVYEFRHLTFQEYLAARALVEGHHPGHDPKEGLAGTVLRLAIRTAAAPYTRGAQTWREAVRLCVASCNDADVDDILKALVADRHGTEPFGAQLAQLALDCLADEPNASRALIRAAVLARANHQSAGGFPLAPLLETRWREGVVDTIAGACNGDWTADVGLAQSVHIGSRATDTSTFDDALEARWKALTTGSFADKLLATNAIVDRASLERDQAIPERLAEGLTRELLVLVDARRPLGMTAAWALGMIHATSRPSHRPPAAPLTRRYEELIRADDTDPAVVRFLFWIALKEANFADPRDWATMCAAVVGWFARAQPVNATSALRDMVKPAPLRLRIIEVLADSPAAVARLAAVSEIVSTDLPALTGLVVRLGADPDPDVRYAVMKVLAGVDWSLPEYQDHRPAVRDLLPAFGSPLDDESRVRLDLVRDGGGEPGARGRILDLLHDADGTRRRRALRVVADCRFDTAERTLVDPLLANTSYAIREDDVTLAARKARITTPEALARCERLAAEWGLPLEWRQEM